MEEMEQKKTEGLARLYALRGGLSYVSQERERIDRELESFECGARAQFQRIEEQIQAKEKELGGVCYSEEIRRSIVDMQKKSCKRSEESVAKGKRLGGFRGSDFFSWH